MTTYTAFDSSDSSTARSGLSLADAAAELLTADSHDYDIRRETDGKGWRLWVTRFSRASTLGSHPMVSSRFFSLRDDEAEATAEIFEEVITDGDWHGMEAMTDDRFAEMMAEIASQDEEE